MLSAVVCTVTVVLVAPVGIVTWVATLVKSAEPAVMVVVAMLMVIGLVHGLLNEITKTAAVPSVTVGLLTAIVGNCAIAFCENETINKKIK